MVLGIAVNPRLERRQSEGEAIGSIVIELLMREGKVDEREDEAEDEGNTNGFLNWIWVGQISPGPKISFEW